MTIDSLDVKPRLPLSRLRERGLGGEGRSPEPGEGAAVSREARTAEWDASSYHQVANPHVTWGQRVLARLHLRGDERVMDAGCGTGRLTADLLERLPDGHVLAVDVSANMLEVAREHL